MSKKEIENLDDEDDLNFDDEFNFDDMSFGDGSETKKDRKPVEQLKDGAKEGFKESIAPDKLMNAMEKALPKKVQNTVDDLKDYKSRTVDIYNDVKTSMDKDIQSIKKSVSKVANHVEKYVPDSYKHLLNKVKDWGKDQDEYVRKSEERENEDFIANEIGNLATLQAELQKQQEARSIVQNEIDSKRHESQQEILIAIRNGIGYTNSFSSTITSQYYQKSLATQYKQLFVQKSIYKTLLESSNHSKVALDSIVKNSALPDFVKQRKSEVMREIGVRRLFDGATNKIGDYTRNFKDQLFKNIKTRANEFKQGFSSVADMASMGTDMLDMTDMDDRTGLEKVGGMGASLATGAATRKIFNSLFKKIDKDGKLSSLGLRVTDTISPEGMNRLATKDTDSYLLKMLQPFIPKSVKGNVKVGLDTGKDLLQTAEFDNLTRKSITDIIPELLSNIHLSVEGIRDHVTGSAELNNNNRLIWDHEEGTLSKRSNVITKLSTKLEEAKNTKQSLVLAKRIVEGIDHGDLLSTNLRLKEAFIREILKHTKKHQGFIPDDYIPSDKWAKNFSKEETDFLDDLIIKRFNLDESVGARSYQSELARHNINTLYRNLTSYENTREDMAAQQANISSSQARLVMEAGGGKIKEGTFTTTDNKHNIGKHLKSVMKEKHYTLEDNELDRTKLEKIFISIPGYDQDKETIPNQDKEGKYLPKLKGLERINFTQFEDLYSAGWKYEGSVIPKMRKWVDKVHKEMDDKYRNDDEKPGKVKRFVANLADNFNNKTDKVKGKVYNSAAFKAGAGFASGLGKTLYDKALKLNRKKRINRVIDEYGFLDEYKLKDDAALSIIIKRLKQGDENTPGLSEFEIVDWLRNVYVAGKGPDFTIHEKQSLDNVVKIYNDTKDEVTKGFENAKDVIDNIKTSEGRQQIIDKAKTVSDKVTKQGKDWYNSTKIINKKLKQATSEERKEIINNILSESKGNISKSLQAIIDKYNVEDKLDTLKNKNKEYLDAGKKVLSSRVGDSALSINDNVKDVVTSTTNKLKAIMADKVGDVSGGKDGTFQQSLLEKYQRLMGNVASGIANSKESIVSFVEDAKSFGISNSDIAEVMDGISKVEKEKPKYFDIYVSGETIPRILSHKWAAGEYFSLDTGEPIEDINDIKGAIIDSDGNQVITEADYKVGLLNNKGDNLDEVENPDSVSGQVNAKMRTIISNMTKKVMAAPFKTMKMTAVYVNEPEGPRKVIGVTDWLTKTMINSKTNKQIKSIKDITAPILNKNGDEIISDLDLQKGLCDKNGRKLAGYVVRRLRWAGDMLKGIAKTRKLITTPAKVLSRATGVSTLLGGVKDGVLGGIKDIPGGINNIIGTGAVGRGTHRLKENAVVKGTGKVGSYLKGKLFKRSKKEDEVQDYIDTYDESERAIRKNKKGIFKRALDRVKRIGGIVVDPRTGEKRKGNYEDEMKAQDEAVKSRDKASEERHKREQELRNKGKDKPRNSILDYLMKFGPMVLSAFGWVKDSILELGSKIVSALTGLFKGKGIADAVKDVLDNDGSPDVDVDVDKGKKKHKGKKGGKVKSPKGKLGKLGKAIRNVGETIFEGTKNIGGKVLNGTKSVVGKTALGVGAKKVVNKVVSKPIMKAIASAGTKVIGKRALQSSLAFLGPLGAIVGTTWLLWDIGSFVWDWMSSPNDVDNFRIAGYGINPENEKRSSVVLKLEDWAIKNTKYDQGDVTIPKIPKDDKEFAKIMMGFMGGDNGRSKFSEDSDENLKTWQEGFEDWYNNRFAKVLSKHAKALYTIDKDMKLNEAFGWKGDLPNGLVYPWLRLAKVNKYESEQPYQVMSDPFYYNEEEDNNEMVGESIVDKYYNIVKNKYEKDEEKLRKSDEIMKKGNKNYHSKFDFESDTKKINISDTNARLNDSSSTNVVDLLNSGYKSTLDYSKAMNTSNIGDSTLTAIQATTKVFSIIDPSTDIDNTGMVQGTVTDSMAIRMRLYGFKSIYQSEQSAIITLEKYLANANLLKFEANGGCNIKSIPLAVMQNIRKWFGTKLGWDIDNGGEDDGFDMWFKYRFLPVYLAWVGKVYSKTSNKDILASENTKLTPIQKYEIYLAIINVKVNYDNQDVDIWSIPFGPVKGIKVNNDPNSIVTNIQNLNRNIDDVKLTEKELQERKLSREDEDIRRGREEITDAGGVEKSITQGIPTLAGTSVGNSIDTVIGGLNVAIGGTNIEPSTSGGSSEFKIGNVGEFGKNVAKELMAAADSKGYSAQEKAMLFAQSAHESANLTKFSENLRYSLEGGKKAFKKKYESDPQGFTAAFSTKDPKTIANYVYGSRMGNKGGDDGWNYRGRGPIQLTGRSNYEMASKFVGKDLVKDPDLILKDPKIAALSTLAWWENKKRESRAFASAIANGDVTGATKGINGGDNGLDDRKRKYQLALQGKDPVTLLAGKTGNSTGPGESSGEVAKTSMSTTASKEENAPTLTPISYTPEEQKAMNSSAAVNDGSDVPTATDGGVSMVSDRVNRTSLNMNAGSGTIASGEAYKRTGSALEVDTAMNAGNNANLLSKSQNAIDNTVQAVKSALTSEQSQKAADICTSRGGDKSKGKCAKYVADGLQQAGYKFARQASAYMYVSNGILESMGFKHVGDGQDFNAQKGDIAIFDRAPAHEHGHICIYNGKQWVSDFLQRRMCPYRDASSAGPVTIWRHPSGERATEAMDNSIAKDNETGDNSKGAMKDNVTIPNSASALMNTAAPQPVYADYKNTQSSNDNTFVPAPTNIADVVQSNSGGAGIQGNYVNPTNTFVQNRVEQTENQQSKVFEQQQVVFDNVANTLKESLAVQKGIEENTRKLLEALQKTSVNTPTPVEPSVTNNVIPINATRPQANVRKPISPPLSLKVGNGGMI